MFTIHTVFIKTNLINKISKYLIDKEFKLSQPIRSSLQYKPRLIDYSPTNQPNPNSKHDTSLEVTVRLW